MSTPQNPELEQKLKEGTGAVRRRTEIAKVALENAIQNMTNRGAFCPGGKARDESAAGKESCSELDRDRPVRRGRGQAACVACWSC
jgi:hypothetical protein